MKLNSKNFLLLFVTIVFGLTALAANTLPEIFNKREESSGTKKQREESVELESDDDNFLSTESEASYGEFSKRPELYYYKEGPVPTNKIWSSAIFTGQIKGLYSYPLAANTSNGGLNLTVPAKIVYEKIVAAQILGDLISIKGSTELDSVYVDNFTDLSVDFVFVGKKEKELFKATFIQGSPYLFVKPIEDSLSISATTYSLSVQQGNYVYTHANGDNFGIFTDAKIIKSGDRELSLSFSDPAKQYLTIGFYRGNSLEEVTKYSTNIVTGVTASYLLKNSNVNITYKFEYASDVKERETLFGFLPHQYQLGSVKKSSALFTANTLRGDEYFIKVKDQTTYKVERVPMLAELPMGELSTEEKKKIGTLIEEDIRRVILLRSSAYFGGNDLLKLARLMQIADEVDRDDLVSQIRQKLNEEFENWFTYKENEVGKYFEFDSTLGGLIGFETTGFGGENFNDHHFQYGYFVHAAAILAQYDKEFKDNYGGFVTALVKDIANPVKNDTDFPYLRHFDQYEGHSWATGFADFSDGNNQESTSEAINAWYAVWLWGQVTGNKTLQETGAYLYSSEINSARHYWLNWYENRKIFPAGYQKNKTSMVWGGKFEYQTFFSTEPQSIEGIQYLPFSPGSVYLYNNNILDRDYNSFKGELKEFAAHLVDLNYMYYAMSKGFGLLTPQLIENMEIDEGMSRTNMYHWTLFWDNIANFSPSYNSKERGYLIDLDKGQSAVVVECGLSSPVVSSITFSAGNICKK